MGSIKSRCSIIFCRLENLNTLAVLCLRGNGITIPPKDALASLQSLQELRMDGNNITVIGKDAFGTMRVISSLSLSNNKVQCVYNVFPHHTSLFTESLDACHTQNMTKMCI